MADRYIIARNIILEQALDTLRCVLRARTAQQRIECSLQLIALTDALGVDKNKPPSYTLLMSAKRWLDKLGVKVERFNSLEEALSWQYHHDFEIDVFVKALLVASSVLAAAATMPIRSQDLTPLA
ncbi:MAG: hypothetical protein QXT27_05030 [Pyrobaculum sp.]